MFVYVICLFISLNMLVLYQVHIILVYGTGAEVDIGPISTLILVLLWLQIMFTMKFEPKVANLCHL